MPGISHLPFPSPPPHHAGATGVDAEGNEASANADADPDTVSRKVAVIALIYLVYSTISSEIDNMLKPPKSDAEIARDKSIKYKALEASGIRSTEPPKSKTLAQGVQGMGYVYQTNGDTGRLDNKNVALPIMTVAPHVLMTSESSYLTGFGEKIKGDNHRLG